MYSSESFSDFKSLCLFRLSAIGDILNLLPSLELVLAHYPHLQVTWVIGKNEYNLFKHLAKKYPNLHFYVFDKKTNYLAAIKEMSKLNYQGEAFDLLIHAQTSLRSNILVKFIPAKQKLGYSKARSFEGHSLVVHKSLPNQLSMHVMFDYFDLFAPYLTYEQKQEFYAQITDTRELYFNNYPESLKLQQNLKPLIDFGFGEPGSAEAEQNCRPELRDLYRSLVAKSYKLSASKVEDKNATLDPVNDTDSSSDSNSTTTTKPRLILISPASSQLKKNWTVAGYVAVIHHLLALGHHLVLSGSKNPTEYQLITDILEQVKDLSACDSGAKDKIQTALKENLTVIAGKTNLDELVIFTQIADLVLSPDSGPMHLASCLGIPTIGLFAYINPMRSGPIQGVCDTVSVFHKNFYGADLEFTNQQYLEDLKNWRSKPEGKNLMEQITASAVIAKLDEVLARLDRWEDK